MRFFYFVEKHNRIWTATDRFGKLAAFLVADVAGRRSDQARGGEFFHVLRHVDLNQRVAIAEHEFGELLREKSFSNAGRPEENERTNRPARILEVGAAAAQRFRDRGDGFVLADHFALQLVFHLEELFGLGLFHSLQRNAGHFGNDVHHVVAGDEDFLLLALLTPLLHDRIEFFLRLFFLVAE